MIYYSCPAFDVPYPYKSSEAKIVLCKCLVTAWVALEERKPIGHFWKYRKSIINISMLARNSVPNCIGENNTFTTKDLKNTNEKNQRFDI